MAGTSVQTFTIEHLVCWQRRRPMYVDDQRVGLLGSKVHEGEVQSATINPYDVLLITHVVQDEPLSSLEEYDSKGLRVVHQDARASILVRTPTGSVKYYVDHNLVTFAEDRKAGRPMPAGLTEAQKLTNAVLYIEKQQKKDLIVGDDLFGPICRDAARQIGHAWSALRAAIKRTAPVL